MSVYRPTGAGPSRIPRVVPGVVLVAAGLFSAAMLTAGVSAEPVTGVATVRSLVQAPAVAAPVQTVTANEALSPPAVRDIVINRGPASASGQRAGAGPTPTQAEGANTQALPVTGIGQGPEPPTDVMAQRPASPDQMLLLDPDSAAALALQNSLDLQLTATSIRDAQIQLSRAFALDDVSASGSMSYRRFGPTSMVAAGQDDEGNTIFVESNNDSMSQGFSLSKTLFTDGRIKRQQVAATKSLESAQINEAVVTRVLDLSARSFVFDGLRTERLAQVAEEQVNAVAAHLDLSRDLLQAGTVAEFEVIQAQTELARTQGQLITARTNVMAAHARLRRLLTLKQDVPIKLQAGNEQQVPDGDQAALTHMALVRRPEVRADQIAVDLAEANLRVAFASRNVTVGLSGNLSRSNSGDGWRPWGWSVSVSASKPILDRRAEFNDVRAAKSRLDAARVRLQQTNEDVALEVTESCIFLQDARERLRVATQGVIEAKERLAIARVRFETGYGLGIEVLDAQTSLTAAEAETANAEFNLQVAVVELRSTVGLAPGEQPDGLQ